MKILKDGNGYGSLNINYQFITEYMPRLSGDSVKLYLYLCYLYESRKDVSQSGVMKALNMSEERLTAAADEIKRENLIFVEGKAIYVNDVAELMLRKKYTLGGIAEREFSTEQTEDEKLFAEAAKKIQEKYFGGRMGLRWLEFLKKLHEKEKMKPDLLLLLFEHCEKYCKPKLTMAYVENVASEWLSENIRTGKELVAYLGVRNKRNKFADFVRSEMNRSAKFTKAELLIIEKWLFEFGYGEEEVSLVLDWPNFNNPTIGAYDRILSDWHSKGLKNAAEIKAYLEKNKSAAAAKKAPEKKGSGASVSAGGPKGNFKQREYGAEHYEWLMAKDNPEASKRRLEKMSPIEIAVEKLREEYFGGVIPPLWRELLQRLYEAKKMSPELIVRLFAYCKKHGNHRITMAYVERVADEWLGKNIKTAEELDSYLENLEPFDRFVLFIKEKINRGTPFLEGEILMMKKWFFDYGYDETVISLMLEKIMLENPTVGAFDKILSSWYGSGKKTVEDIRLYTEAKGSESPAAFEENAG